MLILRNFVCRDCGKDFEKLTENTHIVECPHCGSGHCTYLPSAQAFKVNGVGAYSNKMKL